MEQQKDLSLEQLHQQLLIKWSPSVQAELWELTLGPIEGNLQDWDGKILKLQLLRNWVYISAVEIITLLHVRLQM